MPTRSGVIKDEPAALHPERVAYWYFRLNGFFQIENFVFILPAEEASAPMPTCLAGPIPSPQGVPIRPPRADG